MRFFLLVLCLPLFNSCQEISRDCNDFRTGTFEFEALVGTEIQKTVFVRSDSIEIDYYQGKADTASIRWINDCEYIVKKLHPRNRNEEKAIHMKIITTNGLEYTFEYSEVGKSRKERGVAKKVSNNARRPQ